jgi:hypothetical protein
MRKAAYAWLVIGQGSMIAVIQLIPMLGLPVSGYALYAAVYLGYAAGVAITYATVADVWARLLRRGEPSAALLSSFHAALTSISLACGTLVGVVGTLLSHSAPLGAVAGLAVTTAVFQSGVAYRLVSAERTSRVGTADVIGAVSAGALTTVFLTSGVYSPLLALLSWAAGNTISCAILAVPPRWSPREAAGWFRDHRNAIALLAGEASIKTLESVGTPYLVGGIGGVLALALHRAASSLTYPVRLIVDVLRSRIISGAIGGSGRAVLVVGTLGAVAGTAVGAGLALLGGREWLSTDSIVTQMAPHALAVGAWVWSTSISSFVQFVGRGKFSGRRLILRRTAHTIIVLGATASGVLIVGPAAVVWSAALSELAATALWIPARATHQDRVRAVAEPV